MELVHNDNSSNSNSNNSIDCDIIPSDRCEYLIRGEVRDYYLLGAARSALVQCIAAKQSGHCKIEINNNHSSIVSSELSLSLSLSAQLRALSPRSSLLRVRINLLQLKRSFQRYLSLSLSLFRASVCLPLESASFEVVHNDNICAGRTCALMTIVQASWQAT